MKFLQIATFYPKYLQNVYSAHPELAGASFDEQIAYLVQDGFGAPHIYAPHLRALGYDTMLVVPNCVPAQAHWAQENGLPPPRSMDDLNLILARQVESFRPDILYSSDPIQYDSRFVRGLSRRPPLVMGWRAATIPPTTDWSGYDLIIGSDEGVRRRALELGAKAAEFFSPGFPSFLAHAVAGQPKEWDVAFIGQISIEHRRRLEILTEVAQALEVSDAAGSPLSAGYFLSCPQPDQLPPAVRRLDRGDVWGHGMYRTLKSARINLNCHIDMAATKSQNMRIFETLGVGSFLITEESDSLSSLFEPGREVETYRNVGELIEKIRYYSRHHEEREAIARRGHERCLREHGMEQRAVLLDAMIRRHLGASPQGTTPVPGAAAVDVAADWNAAVAHFSQGRPAEAKPLLDRIAAAHPDHADALHLLGVIAHRQGDNAAAERLILQALALAPEAWLFQANLGVVLHAMGRLDDACLAMRKALARNPVEPQIRLVLGDILEALGRPAEAADAIRPILERHPEHEGAAVRLARLAPPPPAAAPDPAPATGDVLARSFPGVTFGKGVQCIGIANTRIGAGACVADDVWLNVCLRGEPVRIEIGRNVLLGRRSVISSGSHLEIGAFTLLAPNVYVASAEHRYDGSPVRPIYQCGIRDHGSLIIEENCWLGINSVVTGGIRIGRGSVVGANSVVRHDVPPFTVIAGNPARIVRMFNPVSGAWEPVRNAEDQARIEADRQRAGLPTRADYAAFLLRVGGAQGVDPIVAGREEHLF